MPSLTKRLASKCRCITKNPDMYLGDNSGYVINNNYNTFGKQCSDFHYNDDPNIKLYS